MEQFMQFADTGTGVTPMMAGPDRVDMESLSAAPTDAALPTADELSAITSLPAELPNDRMLEIFRQGLETGLYNVNPDNNYGLDRKEIEKLVKRSMNMEQALLNKKMSMVLGFKMDAMPLTPILPLPKAYRGVDGEKINSYLHKLIKENPGLHGRNVRPAFWNSGWNVGVVNRLTNG